MSARSARSAVLAVIIAGLLTAATDTRAHAQEVVGERAEERYASPFPARWLRVIVDEQAVRRPSREGEGHGEATEPGDLEIAFDLWPGETITAGEPLLARVSITNPAPHRVFLPFIGGLGEALHFEVTDAQGRAVGRAYDPPPWRADGPVAAFPAATTKRYETAVSHWYDFAKPGEYTVEAGLIVVDHLGDDGERVVLDSQTTTVRVLQRDPERLADRCEELFVGQLPGEATPPRAAEGGYRPGEEACRHALLHVTDEMALPYLQLLGELHSGYPDAVSAISRVESPKAVEVLRRIALQGHERVRQRAVEELERLGAPVEPQALASAPAVSAGALLEALCEREGLALVADVQMDPETQVHVHPDADVREVAGALNAAGLRAYHSAGGRALVVLGPAGDAPADVPTDVYVTASRLLATVTPEQLALRDTGYIRAGNLTSEQIALLYELLPEAMAPGGPRHDEAPVSKLALGAWPMSGFDVLVRADDEAVTVHGGGRYVNDRPPTELLPEPIRASILWCRWPHALSGRLEDRTVSLGPLRGTLDELLEAGEEPLMQWVELAGDAPGAWRALLVSAREAPLGHLLWALEVATGLQVSDLAESELAEWALTADRFPDRAERPDRLLRLPSLQCRSPHRTPAGAALLATSAPGMRDGPTMAAYAVGALPEWLRTRVIDALPPPGHVGLPASGAYETWGREGRMMVLWSEGVYVEAGVFEADGSGSAVSVDLPAF